MASEEQQKLEDLTKQNEDLLSRVQRMEEQNRQLQNTLQAQVPAQGSNNTAPPPTNDGVNMIGIKVPPFWPEEPEIWFHQLEAQFSLSRITTEATKFNHVVAHLEGRWANEIKDLIRQPPAQNPYTTIKTELINILSKSEAQRVRQLIGEAELGDNTPSQFLRRLKSLAGATVLQENILRTLWLQRLPTTVQAILQAQADTVPVDQLAKIADRIVETIPIQTAPAVYATTAPPFQNDLTLSLSKINETLESLAQRIEKMEVQMKKSRDQRYRNSRSRSRSRSFSEQKRDSDLCYYHETFGEKAYRCQKPCNFPNQSTNSNGSQ